MSATTRTINNTGDPIVTPDGTPAAGAVLIFDLVDTGIKKIAGTFDAVSGEYIYGTKSVTLDGAGEFSITLWPNNRGQIATLYRVTIYGALTKPFYIMVTEGTGAMTLAQARAALGTMNPQDFEDLQMYLALASGSASEAIAAKDLASGYASEAIAAKDLASGYASEAIAAKDLASGYASEAIDAKDLASEYAVHASQWATQTSAEVIPGYGYGAKKYALDAAAAALQGGAEIIINLGSCSGTQVLDMAIGTIFTATVTGPCEWSIVNPQAGVTGITLVLTNGGLTGQTFPGTAWPSGYVPAFTVAGVDIIEFLSLDGWTSKAGFISGRDMR